MFIWKKKKTFGPQGHSDKGPFDSFDFTFGNRVLGPPPLQIVK